MFNKDKILKTKNYDLFSFIEGNRKINRLKVERLKRSMEKKYIPLPILANDKHEIIDGQHRFIAIREMELLLHYTITLANFTPEDLTRINTHGTNWNNDDFLQHYMDKERRSHPLNYKSMPYNVFSSAREETKIHHRVLLSLAFRSHRDSYIEDFKEGKLLIVDKKQFLEDIDYVISIKKYFEHWNKRTFQFALCRLFKQNNFDRDIFSSKLKKYSSILKPCTTTKAYIEMIETLYNYRNRNKVTFIKK